MAWKLLEEQRSSGQSIAAFARGKGVQPWSLYNAQAIERRRALRSSEAQLAEVRIVDAPAHQDRRATLEQVLAASGR